MFKVSRLRYFAELSKSTGACAWNYRPKTYQPLLGVAVIPRVFHKIGINRIYGSNVTVTQLEGYLIELTCCSSLAAYCGLGRVAAGHQNGSFYCFERRLLSLYHSNYL